ncbi:chloramphenicol O-acetyltransferase type A [Cognatiyoonia koreensis]|uniref:Chloramphenicol O-acetyltransferase type A n=1 Tax=Cognatiyoonia koreensis TaxID=364200 RepID=A0A1I0N328_9RHOB|nr:CatA-like O-acetyltransferase [Cognatiyoonia koreensis]SEV95147.1 chloramphenicol O-acetyltransferase type A [Cognatiyoonia koreensis]
MKTIDQDTWPRAAQFRLFRTYARPHYAVTSRLDVTHLLSRKADVSPYRACLWAIGCGLHMVPELLMRFRGEEVVQHDQIALSMTVPTAAGSFNYAYVPFLPEFAAFDAQAKDLIAAAAGADDLGANRGEIDAVAYLSCMPWLDYSSINNALPGPDDCIPRVSWGKFVEEGARWRMAMTLEVHHALVDGQHVGAYFAAVQGALDQI